MRGEHHHGPLRDLLRPLGEDRTLPLQGLHDVLVVDDLVPDIDRRTVLLKGSIDGDHGTVATRVTSGEQDTACGGLNAEV